MCRQLAYEEAVRPAMFVPDPTVVPLEAGQHFGLVRRESGMDLSMLKDAICCGNLEYGRVSAVLVSTRHFPCIFPSSVAFSGRFEFHSLSLFLSFFSARARILIVYSLFLCSFIIVIIFFYFFVNAHVAIF